MDQTKRENDLERLRAGNLPKDFVLRGLSFPKANLSGVFLAGRDLTGIDLAGANLSGANLAGANFTRAKLTATNFSGANLTGAILDEARCSHADFTGAVIARISTKGTDLIGATMPTLRLSPEAMTDQVRETFDQMDAAIEQGVHQDWAEGKDKFKLILMVCLLAAALLSAVTCSYRYITRVDAYEGNEYHGVAMDNSGNSVKAHLEMSVQEENNITRFIAVITLKKGRGLPKYLKNLYTGTPLIASGQNAMMGMVTPTLTIQDPATGKPTDLHLICTSRLATNLKHDLYECNVVLGGERQGEMNFKRPRSKEQLRKVLQQK